MTGLDDRLHAAAEEIREVSHRVPDRHRRDLARRRVGVGIALGAIAIAALVITSVNLRSEDGGTGPFGESPLDDNVSTSTLHFDILIVLDASLTEAEGRHIADELHESWPAIEDATWISAEEARDLSTGPPDYNPSIDHFSPSIRVRLSAATDPVERQQTATGISNALGERAVAVTLKLEPAEEGIEVELAPIRVDCTSELAGFPCSALIDGDPTTSWKAPDGGIGAVLTFWFEPAVQISHMRVENLQDECQFLRNARIRTVEVELNDVPWLHIQNLEDTNAAPQEIPLDSIHTSRVVVKITSAHASSSCGDQAPLIELALQGVTFFGRVAPGD